MAKDTPSRPRFDVTLIGPRYTLRLFTPDEIGPRYIGWLNNPEVNRFLVVRFTSQTYETALAYVSSFHGDNEKYMWGIFPNDADEPVGTATLSDINRDHGVGAIGLLIGEMEYWGKGASNEAMELILEFAFETLGLHRTIGWSYALNHGMNFTFKRLGFSIEDKQKREAPETSAGTHTDGFKWGILADDWRARRRPPLSSGD